MCNDRRTSASRLGTLLILSLGLTLALSTPWARANPPPFVVSEITIPELQAAYDSGVVSSKDVVKIYLERIDAMNQKGPGLNAVRVVNPKADKVAAQLDQERKKTGPRGPLHGVPIIIKDNIDTFDMETTAGSIALAGSYPPRDAYIAERLRAAGAIILGKANLSEFANFIANGMPSGYSSYGGQVLMPYDFDVNVSGSSSGSAAAAASNLAAITIGTETSGSITSPSNRNSIVGIKPTVGLWSRSGIIPIAMTQDTAGPMTRTVTDAAILLGALTGYDPRDPKTAESIGHALTDYTPYLVTDGLNGAKICVVRSSFPTGDALVVMNDALAAIQSLGATLVDPVTVPSVSAPSILNREFKFGINEYLAFLGPNAPVHTLAEIIAFNNLHLDRVKYGQAILTASEVTLGIFDPNYVADRDLGLSQSRSAIDTTLTSNGCTALLYAGSGGAGTSARAGYPSIVVPAGFTTGNQTPQGLMLVGTKWDEPTIIKYAYAFEQATFARRTPEEINPAGFQCDKKGVDPKKGGRQLPVCPPA